MLNRILKRKCGTINMESTGKNAGGKESTGETRVEECGKIGTLDEGPGGGHAQQDFERGSDKTGSA